MAESDGRLTRRTLMGAPMALGPAPAAAQPKAPAGYIWVCVRRSAWAQLTAAAALLAGFERTWP